MKLTRDMFTELMTLHFQAEDTKGRAAQFDIDFNEEINWVTLITEALFSVYSLGVKGGYREEIAAAEALANMTWFDNFGEVCYMGRLVLIEDLTQGVDESAQHVDEYLYSVIEEAREVAQTNPEVRGEFGA